MITYAINKACCTVTENKPNKVTLVSASEPGRQAAPDSQIQQSVTLAFVAGFFSLMLALEAAVGDSGTPPSARSCFMASLLLREAVTIIISQGFCP